MILTLCSPGGTHHIEISADQFMQLRAPDVTPEEIETIAAACKVPALILKEYADDLKKSAQEMIELDGSCDYSDHL
jgi:hypothetical protein